MSFSINTNISSLQAQNYLQQSSTFQAQTINEVTSGLRIVNSGDDAAGLAIANGYKSDETVLTQGIQNANDGLATLQTIDGGMDNINTLLDRASTLATESASGTFTGDRSTLNSEFQSVITEINRQAQSIGMNQGGQFAKDLSVFIGGGQGATSAAASANGSIDLDLSKSTVDAQSLGLQGVQATGNTSTDIGTGSANTSVQSILANAANTASEGTSGYTTFNFSGPGFGGSNGMSVSVNLAGVTDSNTLATAINTAIQNAGNGSTQAATAFKNANISASVVTNASGQQQLAFSSSTSAFQVQAGDKTANALLGNFAQNASLEGADTNAALSANGLSFSSLQVDGNSVSLSAATTQALAGGAKATSGSVSGLATVSDTSIAALNSNAGTGSDTLVLNVNGTNQSISIASGTSSLAQIASQITSSSAGVTATVTGSGSTQKLTLTSNATGSSSNVSVGDHTAGTSTELLAANITGFTGTTAGTAGTSGSVATATSGSLTSTATINDSTIGALNSSAGTAANDKIAFNVNGVQKSVTLTTGDTTLASIQTDINNANIGVTAAISGSGSTQQLTLTSNDTGSNSNVSILGTAAGTSSELLASGVLGLTAATTGNAGQDATAPLTKAQVVNILNKDSNFSSAATASLDGNKVVIQSNTNASNSSVQATGSLATALGFSTTAATAGSASTGARLNTTVQSAGAMGQINQAVISSLSSTGTGAAIAAGGANSNLTLSVNGGASVTLALGALASGSSVSKAAADVNTAIAGSSLAGQVQAVVNDKGDLTLQATHAGQSVTVGTASSNDGATNLGFTNGQTSGTSSDALATSSDNIQVQFTGAGMSSPVTLSLSSTAGVTKMSDLLTSLTSQVANNSALAAAGISLTTGSSGNNLVFTDNQGQNFQVAVTGDSTNALGFGSFTSDSNGDFSYSSISGSSALPTTSSTGVSSSGTLNISLNGGATSAINVNLKSTDATVSGTATTDASVAALGLSSSDKIALDVNGVVKTVTMAGTEKSLADVAATINGTASLGVKADIVGTGANQTLRLTGTATGGSVTVLGTAASSTANGLAAAGLTTGQSGQGLASAAAVQADAVSQINASIANNSALSGAGIQASVNSSGDLALSSSNGTNFRVGGSGATNLGFGTTGGAYAGTTTSAAPTVGRVDSAGAYTTGAMSFSGIANGGDNQTISITATDASGGNHSTSIALQNNSTSQSGSNIDSAINAINKQLQDSNDSTLQSIYAVKEDNPNGTESINFMSTTQNFKVAASSLSDGSGVSTPAGGVATATQNGAGANISIDSMSGAAAAVNALSTAVQNLGTAQAAVGKGENLLNYATSLAQSQLTNEAASESDIRDANLAQEAANLTKAQILMQAGTAALSQANSAPQQLLSLLQGH
jgi:flagellin